MSLAKSGLKPFTLAFVQLGQIGANKTENLKHAREMILKAASSQGHSKKPDLVVLPEYFNTPYGDVSLSDFAEEVVFEPGKPYDATTSKSQTVNMLASAAKETGTWLIGGELVAKHRKVHLFDVDIPGKITVKESAFLNPGAATSFFDTEFARIGLGVCYDVRFPELAMISARRGGCQVLIYPGAFTMATGPLHWELLQRSRAVDNQVFMGMCSPARNTKATLVAVSEYRGKVLVEAGDSEEIVYVDIDPEVLESARSGIPVTTQRRFDVYTNVAE
ncbi:Hydrolase C26A3.11 [Leucoagaricus sp. SymC.cos]|nr:Hydrolase C26A3.11 [Leucoagaricus sp. SymC.cos]